MPVPTLITDLDPIAGNNSPASSESPKDGDDYIRALSAFIAQCYLGDAINATNLTGAAQSVAHVWSAAQSFTAASGEVVRMHGRASDSLVRVSTLSNSGGAYTAAIDFQGDGAFTFRRGATLDFSMGIGPVGEVALGTGTGTYGTSGQVATSNGPGAAATWQTPAGGVAADWTRSIAASGYQKLPGGLILQWGTFTTNASGYTNLTFPVAFPTGLLSITGSSVNSSASNVCVNFNFGAKTATYIPTALVTTSATYVAQQMTFIAIGY